jgi:hypothetical protein
MTPMASPRGSERHTLTHCLRFHRLPPRSARSA